jgi:general stress protein CsbA
MSFSEFFQTPFAYLFQNLVSIPQYVFWEMGFIVPLFGLIGFYFLYQKDRTLFWYLVIWFAIPYLIISLFAKVLYPRYITYLGSILLITASYYLSTVKWQHLRAYLLVIFLSVAPFLYTIWFNHAHIPFPQVDRGQYIEGWPAGWGAQEIVTYAEEQSKKEPVHIIAEGNFGMSGDVLNVLKGDNENISVSGYWPLTEESLQENMDLLEEKQVYVVFSHRTEFPEDEWPIERIKVYDRPGDEARMALFRLVPEEN